MKRNLVIIQARMSSTRFPGKVLAELNGQPMIAYLIKRVMNSEYVDQIVVATSTDSSDDELSDYLQSIHQPVHRGPLEDVLTRFLAVLDVYNPHYFIRITGDCPLVMPELIDSMIQDFENSDSDYLSNVLEPSFPDGLDVEIISTSALRRLSSLKVSQIEREHVTLGMYSRPLLFSLKNFHSGFSLQDERWTVDYPEDLEFVRQIVSFEKTQKAILSFQEVLNYLNSHPEVRNMLTGELRNEALKDWEPRHE